MATHHLGIDIHPEGISAVLMLNRLKSASVIRHWEIPFGDGVFSPENLSTAVSTLMDEAGIDGCDCAVGLPASWCYFRQAALPFREKKKIEKVLPYEVEPMLPLAAENLVVDYQITLTGEADTVLMTMALEKTLLADIIDSLEGCGINPGILTIGGYPEMALLQHGREPAGDTVLVAVAGGQVTILLGNGQHVLSVRCLDGGASPLAPAGVAAGVHQAVLSFQDSRARLPFSPELAFISGPAADITALSAALAQGAAMTATRWHPAEAAENIRSIDTAGPAMTQLPAGAFSLALASAWGFKGPNFRKGPFAASKFWQEHRKALIAPALIGLLILMTAGYRSISAINDYQQRLDAINTQIARTFQTALPEAQRMVNPVQQMRSRLAELRQEAPQFDQTTPARRVVDIMHAISTRIPPELAVVLSQMVVNPGTVLISGETESFNDVNTVQQRLEAEPMFKSVSISSANQQKTGNRVNFRIRILL